MWVCSVTFTRAVRTSRNVLLLRPGWVIQWRKRVKCKLSGGIAK